MWEPHHAAPCDFVLFNFTNEYLTHIKFEKNRVMHVRTHISDILILFYHNKKIYIIFEYKNYNILLLFFQINLYNTFKYYKLTKN